MQRLTALFKRIEELSNSFNNFEGINLPSLKEGDKFNTFQNINLFTSLYSIKSPKLVSHFNLRVLTDYTDMMSKLFDLTLNFKKNFKLNENNIFEKSEIFKNNFAFNNSNFNFQEFRNSFSQKGNKELLGAKQASSNKISNLIFNNKSVNSIGFEETFTGSLDIKFDEFGEKLAYALKNALSNKDRAAGY